ncbi:DUF1056 family protein [Lacticaseibacillus sp. 866-1]|uniref:DUF1056 family protein n=1 Tax=Lacticaseibacillus sp. 866-1 TaxID=2799576 RepID=UPI0019410C31|nr:DUF1056 family protein [Lacticaseibacillus sp. 866-1]
MEKLETLRQWLPMFLFSAGVIAIVTSLFLFNVIVGTLGLGIALLFCGWLLTPTPSAKGGGR